MAASGVGNLVFLDEIMTQDVYLRILQQNLQPSVDRLDLPLSWSLVHDNDPKHTATKVRTWLLFRVPHVLPHPPQSPDLNVIEHLWDELDRKIRLPTVQSRITSKETLKSALRTAWDEIQPEVTQKLVQSMPRRLQAVITARGGSTKY
jgi:transposase